MNKYQIAWEHIKTLKGSNFGYYGQFTQSFLAFEEDEVIINELVEKVTHKKPVYKKDYIGNNQYFCPTCNNVVPFTLNRTDQIKYPFCRYCGQRIDWSDEK